MNQNRQTTFSKLNNPQNLLAFHFLFSAICGSLVFLSIFGNVAGGRNLFQANLSIEKTMFLFVVLLSVLFFYAAAFYFSIKPDQAQRISTLFFDNPNIRIAGLRIGGVGFILSWVGYFIPSRLMFGGIPDYFSLIKPLLLWGCLFFVSQIAVIRVGSGGQIFTSVFSSYNSFYRPLFVVFFPSLVVFMLVVHTGIGVSVREDYWYGAGVPVLWIQIAFSLFLGTILSLILSNEQLVKRIPRIDAIVFILLWVVAAYLWGTEPLQASHFMPDTGVNEIYPYSDGATFDIGSQYALIGQGLFNGQYFDRSLYSALLTYFHALAGQNTEALMMVQAVVYAVFPAILYLLGKELHGRVLGVALAALIIFRGINAVFGASMIDSAGPKMMLTDFPTAIGVSLIMLFILKWMNNPQRVMYMAWAGCLIGLTLLLRTHIILFLPFIITFIIFIFSDKKVLWIYAVALLIVGMLVSTLPLDIQNQKKGVPMFYMYYSRIQLVLKARYGLWDDSSSRIPQKPTVSLLAGRERLISYKDSENPICDSRYCAVANHFFHNLITSVLGLPTSFVWGDFRYTVKESAPYWKQDWTGGGLSGENYALLFSNLALISVGIKTVWEKWKYGALLSLMIYFVYMLSNSLAFTSGGRYITPVDWIVLVFYIMGALKLFFWFLGLAGIDVKLDPGNRDVKNIFEIPPVISMRNLIGTFISIFMIGSVVPLADTLFPLRYHDKAVPEVVATLQGHGLLEDANLNQTDVLEFLNTPDARLTSGRLLYPRFYPSDKGEYGLDYPYTALDFRRLVFMVIGPLSPFPDGVIFSVENSIPGLHASDVVVLGCANSNYLDAAIIFILSEPKKIYIRSEGLILQCPLPRL